MTDDTIDEKKLNALLNEVAELPRSIEPPAGSWAKIKGEIEARPARAARIAWWQRPVFLAAAALLLVATSSIITTIAMNRRANGPAPQIARAALDTSNGKASLAQFTAKESDYLRTVNDLSAILDAQEESLSPATKKTLRESIRIIDAAILEARNALAADPANRTLMEMLANSYEQKVDLLKRTTEMARG